MPIRVPVRDWIYPFSEILLGLIGFLADLVPSQIKSIIPIVVSLGIGGMCTVGDVADRIDFQAGDQGPVGVGSDDRLGDNFLGSQDDTFGCEGRLFLLPENAPQVRVSVSVGPLGVDNRDIREKGGTTTTSVPEYGSVTCR